MRRLLVVVGIKRIPARPSSAPAPGRGRWGIRVTSRPFCVRAGSARGGAHEGKGPTMEELKGREYQGISIPPAGKYELDVAHTLVGFVARHMLTKVRGQFTEFSGWV